ncbi:hypothetical protein NQ318_005873 [Aromia moschata]|uniref:Uncharacterized protein n=1 Tax=Aromia moschata TaxID=1265417 RepID=A0AAV8YSA8_9CUCU|nr:hypothetical protein NQ318_005873 [Aromia moschata]
MEPIHFLNLQQAADSLISYQAFNIDVVTDTIALWVTQIKTYSWDNAQVILVGNKCDMEDERVISFERGKQLAEQLGVEFFETSAKENINVKSQKAGTQYFCRLLFPLAVYEYNGTELNFFFYKDCSGLTRPSGITSIHLKHTIFSKTSFNVFKGLMIWSSAIGISSMILAYTSTTVSFTKP